jgi:hypothetical protein
MKNPLTPAGIEPATFRFVAQHLTHCATAVVRQTVLQNFDPYIQNHNLGSRISSDINQKDKVKFEVLTEFKSRLLSRCCSLAEDYLSFERNNC